MSQSRSKNTNEWVVALIGIVIIVLAGWWIGSGHFHMLATQTVKEENMPVGIQITVQNQKAGNSVVVDDVNLGTTVVDGSPVWVAVKETGELPHVLGAARITKSGAVSVSLLRGTKAGNTYTILMYGDDGDRMFDLHKDTPLAVANAATFEAQ